MTSQNPYGEAIGTLAAVCLEKNWPLERLDDLFKEDDAAFSQPLLKAIENRKAIVNAEDRESYTGLLLQLGLYQEYGDLDSRIACCAVRDELAHELDLLSMCKSFEPYREDHPLFKAVPSLWPRVRRSGERPLELISTDGIQWDVSDQLACFGAIEARVCGHVSPDLLKLAIADFPESPAYIRLDPYDVGENLQVSILEEVIRPANPKWWKNLDIWPEKTEGACYELQRCERSNDDRRYREYECRHFGKMEILFRRNHNGMLSGMMEEIHRPHECRFILGRCVHLTSNSPVGDSWDGAVATHIDAAINVYVDDDKDQRWASRLDKGQKVDATFRTHVLRLDEVPLRTVLPIAERFFKSEVLLEEWFLDQFRDLFESPAGNSPESPPGIAPSPDGGTGARG